MQAIQSQKILEVDLTKAFQTVRAFTMELCAPLETEDYIPQPTVDVSPPKWNIAHTSWFFEEMILKKFAPEYREFNPQFGFLFNSYYNSIGTRTKRDIAAICRVRRSPRFSRIANTLITRWRFF